MNAQLEIARNLMKTTMLRPAAPTDRTTVEARKIRVLLVKNDPDDVRMLCGSAAVLGVHFEWECQRQLASALEGLGREHFDVILLDLGLADAAGIDAFLKVRDLVPETPIVVLVDAGADSLAARALKEGALDYLAKGHLDGHVLLRALHYAVERHQLQEALGCISQDPVTGLYNRHSFMILADQQLKLVTRSRGLLTYYAELDGIQQYNPPLSYLEEQRLLIRTGKLLRQTFRDSDIIAHWGRFEFAVLAIDAFPESTSILADRWQDNVQAYNQKSDPRFQLSMSWGVAYCDPKSPASLGTLIAKADDVRRRQQRGRPSGQRSP